MELSVAMTSMVIYPYPNDFLITVIIKLACHVSRTASK